MSTPAPNPKDSLKSTWRRGDRSEWTIYQWLMETLGMLHISLDEKVPIHAKDDPVPYVPHWLLHRWILVHAVTPLILHQAYCYFTGKNFGPLVAFLYYNLWFKAIAIHQLQAMRWLGHKYGFLDGDKHERDGVPDASVTKIFYSLSSTSTFRSMMAVILAYRTGAQPTSINLAMLPLEIGLYGIVLDFWFYWYHRVMHEFDSLWKFHRTHHLTKHPNPLLTLFADTEQEFFDIAGIPLMAYFTLKLIGLPMGFYEWWICQAYVVFTELAGHSGLRIYATAPSPLAWFMRLLDAELVLEDHDLHHRKGWKTSGNYGKHTRLWDYVFGTLIPRIECSKDNIDYTNTVDIPLMF